MYRETTRAIQVTVEPSFVEAQSSPDENHYFWAYKIEIQNLGEEVVRLRSRYWQITDANGKIEEVRGPGVVGKQPVLKPGETFAYTSGCPLSTSSGIMVGSYQMQNDAGETFAIAIPAFSLDMPDAPRTMN
jgi:ApaG protein